MIVPFPKPVALPAAEGWYSYLDRAEWVPATAPDDQWFEEINGVRVEKKMGAPEVRLANRLNAILVPHVVQSGLGETYVEIDLELPVVGNKRKPDLAYVSYQTWPRDRPVTTAWWVVAPDPAVEVVSPYELTLATLAKVQEYFAAGVKQVWLVLPNVQQVYCYTAPTAVRILTRADDLTADPLIPGFRLPLAELFPPSA